MNNKIIKNLIFSLALFIVPVLGLGNVDAASTITVGKVWSSNGIYLRNTTKGDPAYCMNKEKGGPAKGTKLTLKSTHKKGPYVYIINDTKIAGSGNTGKARTIKQKALWSYKGSSISGSYSSEAKKLVKAAKNAGSSYEIKPQVVSVTTPSMTKSGSYYTSNKITVKLKDVKDNSYSVTFSGAPKNTSVIEKSGNTFKVRVPVSSVTKTTTFSIIITGKTSSWHYVKTYHKNNNLQDLSVPVKESVTPSKTVKATVTFKSCHIIGSTYYGKNGNVVSQATYYNECNPKCTIKDGKYYNKSGKPVTELEYNNECNPKCEIKDGKYYDKNGNAVTEEVYNDKCNPKCTIKDNTFYGKNGNIVAEEVYNNECNPKCEIKDNTFYGKNGNIVTEEVYNNECNPSCKIENNTYYGKNNNIVTKEVYEKECTKTIVKRVVIPNTGAERNYAGIAVGISMILGSVYLFFRQKNIFNK